MKYGLTEKCLSRCPSLKTTSLEGNNADPALACAILHALGTTITPNCVSGGPVEGKYEKWVRCDLQPHIAAGIEAVGAAIQGGAVTST